MNLRWQATGPARGFRAQLSRVHDGDSAFFLADLGFSVRAEVELRLTGVRAPELNQPGGRETTDFVNGWLAAGAAGNRRWPFWIECLQTSAYEPDLKMTFTRYIATVWLFDQRGLEQSLNYHVNTFLSGHPEWPPGE